MPRWTGRWGAGPAIERSSSHTLPPSGAYRPEMTLMQVVLPEPLGPTRPRISPDFRSKLKPSSARKPPKRLTRFSTVRSGERGVPRDIDPPTAQQRDQSGRQEQHHPPDEEAATELATLRRRDAHGVVNAIED